MPLHLNLIVFVGLCVAVWVSGTKMTAYCEEFTQRTSISRETMGFVVLALLTQLPEIVTNSTGALRGQGQLVVNSMFGGVLMQTAVLAGADLVLATHSLTYAARRSINLVQGVLLIALLAVTLSWSLAGDVELAFGIGVAPLSMALLYVGAVTLLLNYEKAEPWHVKRECLPDGKDDEGRSEGGPLGRLSGGRLAGRASIAAMVLFAASVGAVLTSEAIADQTDLGDSFVGATLLASATSLPELSTTVKAVRIGAYSMAVSDILGSNMIMLVLLLPTDALYRQGLLFDAIDPSAQFALAAGILISAVYLVGLLRRNPRKFARVGLDSWFVLFAYGLAVAGLYHLR